MLGLCARFNDCGSWFGELVVYLLVGVGAIILIVLCVQVYRLLEYVREIVDMTIITILFIASLFLPGCMLATLGQVAQSQDLSPDQIRAYQEAGAQPYGCVGIGGPPPIGGLSWIFAPKDVRVIIKYGPQCQLLSAEIGGVEEILRVIRVP